MIVHDFDVECIAGLEPKADPPLIIDTDAEEAISSASKGLTPIVRWHPEIIKPGCTVDHLQLALSNDSNIDAAGDILATGLGILFARQGSQIRGGGPHRPLV